MYLHGKILTSLFLNLFTGKLALTNLLGLAFMLAKRWKEKDIGYLMKQKVISRANNALYEGNNTGSEAANRVQFIFCI